MTTIKFKIGKLLLSGLAVLAIAACSTSPGNVRQVNRVDFEQEGKTWPLSVDSGELACRAQAVTFRSGGAIYAVNGTAMSHTDAAHVRAIWLDDSQYPGLKISIGDLIDAGLALCEEG